VSFTPTSHTFVAGDDGAFTASATLKTAPSQTVTATDSGNSFTDTKTVTVDPAEAATFTVAVASNPAATAVASNFTAVAHDAFNNVATGYRGTATFTSSDSAAAFSATTHTFIAGDSGAFTGTVTFNTIGLQSVTATDGAITGTSTAVTVNAWFGTTNSALHVRRLAVDTTTAIAYAATNGDGVFISGDNGSTWSPANTQPTDTSVEEIAVAPTTTASVLYTATTTGGVFTSTDDGATWAAANGSTTGTPLADPNTRSIVTDAADTAGKTAYVGTTTDVFVTTDAGATKWTSTGFPTTNDSILALAIGGGNVYAATHGGIVYKYDGTAWTDLALTPNPGAIDSLAFNAGTLLAGAADGHVFVYDGTTWTTTITAGTHPIVQITIGTAVGYAASNGEGVFKTTDSGATWTAATSGITNLAVGGVAVDATTVSTVFAGTDGDGFFKTLSAGQ
jgi:hypothetical protein